MRVVLISLFAIALLSGCSGSSEQYMEKLSAIAEDVNQKCPKMLDSETRLDGIDVREPNVLVYRYTLVNFLSENVDTALFRRALWPGILSTVKVSADMKVLREAETVIEYAYRDKNNASIYTFRITPDLYK